MRRPRRELPAISAERVRELARRDSGPEPRPGYKRETPPMPGDMRDRLDALQTIKGPTRSGVYFLWDGDRIAYVGSSLYGVFGHTIADHHHGARYGVLRKEFDRVSFLPVPAELLASVTSAFVRRLRPKYNKVVRVADDPDAERRDDDLLRCFGFAV